MTVIQFPLGDERNNKVQIQMIQNKRGKAKIFPAT